MAENEGTDLGQNIAAVFAEENVASDVVIPGSGETANPPPPPDTPPADIKPGDPPADIKPADIKPADPPPPPVTGLDIAGMAGILKTRVSNSDFQYEIPKTILTGQKEDGTKLTSEELFDEFRAEVYKFTDFGDDAVMEEYREAKKDPNFSQEKFFQSKTLQTGFFGLDDDTKVFLGTKATIGDKMSDDEIKTYVKEMDKVEKIQKAKQYTESYAANLRKQQDAAIQEHKANNQKVITQTREADSKKLELLFGKLSTVDNIGGLPHGKAEQEAFKEAFKELYDIDAETGNRRYEKLFEENPENLYNALLFLSMVKNGDVKNFISKFKTSFVGATFDKLGTGQRSNDGSVIEKTPPTPDFYVD